MRIEGRPDCPLCSGEGRIVTPVGMSVCSCVMERVLRDRSASIEQKIPASYRHCSRSTWEGRWPLDSDGDSWAPRAGAMDRAWAVILLGPKGAGKTHIATWMFRSALERDSGLRGLWMDAEEALKAVQREMGGAGGGADTQALMAEVDLLLYDDLGRQRAKNSRGDDAYALELIRSTLHQRHLHRRPTILTSNALDLAAFNRIDPALASRLSAQTLVYEITGRDRRMEP